MKLQNFLGKKFRISVEHRAYKVWDGARMGVMRWKKREKLLIRELQKIKLSPSHEFDHLKRVSQICLKLVKKYSSDRNVLIASALLHDLARSDKRFRGARSASKGAKLAKPILKQCGYSKDEIKLVCQCIAEHDQPELKSKLLEARILKDADFLDGFGARSILRSVMYAGETGGGIIEAITRMKDKGRKRLEGLEFIESKRLGWRMHRLTEVFLSELEKIPSFENVSYPGKLIVIEGISGSGKDTQAKLLANHLRKRQIKVEIVNHPTPFLKKLWRQWRTQVDDRFSELFLLLADRSRMVKDVVLPELKKGKVVISTRSQISAQVYQRVEKYSSAFYRFCFAFEPVADLYLFLDISAKEALRRTDERVKKGVEKDRGFFGKNQEHQKELYNKILKNYPNVKRVNGDGTVRIVANRVEKAVDKFMI